MGRIPIEPGLDLGVREGDLDGFGPAQPREVVG
jgi:hypothetical protein